MFSMPRTSLPYRNRKDMGRAHQIRGLARRRTAGPSIEDTLMPMRNPALSPWQRDLFGHCSPLFSRFEDLGDEPLPRSMSSSDYGYPSPFAKDASRRAEYSRETVPFDTAADYLCQALQYATKHCKGMKEHFEKETSSIALWAPPNVVDALWSIKADWDGVDHVATEKTTSQQPAPGSVAYKSVVERLLEALEDMKMSGRPRFDSVEDTSSKLSQEIFPHTMNKLDVMMQGIEHLMHSVRKDRRLVEPLVKDLVSATALLKDFEELWTPRRRPASHQARCEWDEDDYAWSR